MDSDRAIEEAELCYRLGGISAKTLDRMIESGDFPGPFYLTERKKVWHLRDVEAFLYLRGRIGDKKFKKSEKSCDPLEGDTEG